MHLLIISAKSKVTREHYSQIPVQSLEYVMYYFRLEVRAESLKFHGHLRNLQTPSNKPVSSVKYPERPFISFYQSCRKHSNSCFLTSKGFTFLFHWDGNFQMILTVFPHGKRFCLLNGFVLPCRKFFFDQVTSEKGKIVMEMIIFSCYEGIFNIKCLANPP